MKMLIPLSRLQTLIFAFLSAYQGVFLNTAIALSTHLKDSFSPVLVEQDVTLSKIFP